MVEVVIEEQEEPDDTLLAGSKAQIHLHRYNDKYKRFKERKACYLSNKAHMCSVVKAQCDPSMQAKLQVTEGWEDNKTDLLFVITTAQAVCIGVQRNYSVYIAAREAMRSLANCFQNNETALRFKKNYLACKKKCDKAGIGLTFSKKFLDLEKIKNPKLDDAAATKAAENRCHGTMWLLNSEVPSTVTKNLVQNHIVGIDSYPKNVEQAFTMLVAHLWPRHTNQAGHAKLVAAQGAVEVDEGGPGEAQDAVVHNQAEQTDAIGAAGAIISSAIAPILPVSEER